MKGTIVIAAVIAALCAIGCDSVKPDNYYPMGTGSTWSYTMWSTLETTGESVDTMMTGTTEVEVTGTRQLTAGGDVAEFVSTVTSYTRLPMPDTTVEVDTQYVRDAGDYILAYESLDDAEPDTVLPADLAENKSWHANDSTLMTAEAQEDVTVAAGTFEQAWRVKIDLGSGSEVKQWVANHVGLVKLHMEFEPQSGYKFESHTELVSSDVKE